MRAPTERNVMITSAPPAKRAARAAGKCLPRGRSIFDTHQSAKRRRLRSRGEVALAMKRDSKSLRVKKAFEHPKYAEIKNNIMFLI
ncbi:hypothetical protein RND71_027291 [Anisodus tanguticus]|uniref:Uncharacterized protein n=1 Tax=Anisodus tanguticus TaxID=243964 RepID=A0AAE1V0D4_9SOLA|nr:hypothetical protein RND71_027291 [Anisodus tanguticus]